MGQEFTLVEVSVPPEEAVAALEGLLEDGVGFVATMADADTTLALADAAGDRALILNALAPDDRLRGEDCRANLLHLAPSRAMLTDALAQYLMSKRWSEWLLIEGSHPEDRLLADAYRRSAEKFGASIVESRVFEDTGGARRTDSGHVQVQRQIPVFTQRAPEHHVVVAADESEIFAAHLPYHTWEPRPVTGSAGLTPATWHPAMEAWGGTQLQTRFEAQSSRPMRPEDYNVWMALRVLGEAATRAGSTDPGVLRDYHPRAGVRAGDLQGPARDLPRLGRAAAPADPAGGGQRRGLGLAAGGVRAPGLGARHARHRRARERLRARIGGDMRRLIATTLIAAAAAPGLGLYRLCQQRARQLDQHPRQRDAWRSSRRCRSASGRAGSTSAPTASGSTSSPPTTTTCR